MASGRRKVVKWRRCWPAPQGACGAGGAPAPGSGATTPFPEAGVRKHPAPQGALRRVGRQGGNQVVGQKAPSTRRCIKTQIVNLTRNHPWVRKHPAPEGALRRTAVGGVEPATDLVRKHPAPQGALRLLRLGHPGDHLSQARKHPAPQGALRHRDHVLSLVGGQAIKHPAPEGALRREMDDVDTVHAGHARKHPAPEGALRLVAGGELADDGGVRKHPAPESALRLLTR